MNLSNIKPPKGQVKKQRRVGQGMVPAEESSPAAAPRVPARFPVIH